MKFKYVRKVEGEVNSYNGEKVKTGDVVELTGHLAEKALKNPDYERVSASEPEGIEGLHWTQLKKKVEEAGGTYESKEQAIEFLNGLQ